MPDVIAVAALVRDGRVLLAHRHPQRRWYPDCWDLVGGHVEAGETPEEAVVRECVEELGVRIIDPLPIAMTFADPAIQMHAFVVRRWEGEPVNAAPEEHDDLRWFEASELGTLTLAHPVARQDLASMAGRSHCSGPNSAGSSSPVGGGSSTVDARPGVS